MNWNFVAWVTLTLVLLVQSYRHVSMVYDMWDHWYRSEFKRNSLIYCVAGSILAFIEVCCFIIALGVTLVYLGVLT